VGRGTYEADAPRLDVRLVGLEGRSPRRILLSRSGQASEGWEALARPEDIAALERVDHLLIEGGAETAAAFLRADLVDRLLLYRAPVLLGGTTRAALGDIGLERLDTAHGRWRLVDSRMFGPDRLEVYARVRGE
jgi:diaminohydroxyphosphoribosylaminopyrimidine deaminase / 5-amino-6-(5-phosphoribosylamino)uracil reductase